MEYYSLVTSESNIWFSPPNTIFNTRQCPSKATPVANIYPSDFLASVIQSIFFKYVSVLIITNRTTSIPNIGCFWSLLPLYHTLWQILVHVSIHCSLFPKIKKWCSQMHSPLWFNERRKETIAMVVSKWVLKGLVMWGHTVLYFEKMFLRFVSLFCQMMIGLWLLFYASFFV